MELATLLFLGNLGGTEIFVIVFVILLFLALDAAENDPASLKPIVKSPLFNLYSFLNLLIL